MTTLKERIEELSKFTGWTVGEIATHAQVSSSSVSQWLGNGSKIIKSIGIKPATNLEIATGFRALWLSKGELPKKVDTKNNENVDAARAFAGEVPVISWVQAGAWNEAADPFQPGEAERYLPIFRGHSSSTFALKVRGDSMTATYGKSYPQGSYIIVDPAKLSPNNGDRVIAKLEGSDEVTFKVYKDEDGRKWLAPLNQSHPPIMEAFKIIGTVIGKWEDE